MIRKTQFINYIRQGNFRELFVSELGWNRFRGQSELPLITVDDTDYNILAIAELRGFHVLICEVDEIPTQSIARKIDSKLRRQAQDYICIYRLRNTDHDLWVVPVRTNEKRDLVMIEYEAAEKAELLYSKIEGFSFAFDENTNIVDLRAKVQGTFAVNSEKITKDFYAGFKKEHKAFAEFISGIDDHVAAKDNKNKQWYTSVMLNRLMFCYFIQKKGFLNFDTDYMRNKLEWVRKEQGENRFFSSFYRGFLSSLFHDGLNAPLHNQEFIDKYGRIPYLNGGMFDEHRLERDYAGIDIADEAFIRLFDFFDKWRWHLDTRITASGKDINPDVLGYIFEQYINDRAQMGAYYTKEDITEYIGRNCILTFLFDKVRTITPDSRKYFAPDGFVWQTLRESGDRYIFDAVKKGYSDFGGIPPEIQRGIITEDMRKEYSETPIGELPESHVALSTLRSEWNTRTPEPWGLSNEIWRETIERLQRCDDILGKIRRGEITSINNFITYNLDIRTFALDLLAKADNRFVGWFYKALQSVTILDPTSGSGAFLLAAMNILEPLYEICIERMQEFNNQNPRLFKDELAEITDKYHSNIQYFIFKSIILRNLYGVDIMVEATEIAKLRLFLKMVAVVNVDRRADNLGLDPLPDIDFNIRCGNTLVGYANRPQLENDLSHAEDILQELANQDFKQQIDDGMHKVESAYRLFVYLQLHQDEDIVAFKQAKHDLAVLLKSLNDKLNHRLHSATSPSSDYESWLKSHQPFHWLAEFYQIIEGNGGFDVIIGNPPYVVYTKKDSSTGKCIKDLYRFNWCKTFDSNNLYVFTLERSLMISSNNHLGFIVPLSFGAGKKNQLIRSFLQKNNLLHISSFEIRPAKLFDGSSGADQRLNIIISSPSNREDIFSTKVLRWNNEWRKYLFNSILYSRSQDDGQIWRFSSGIEHKIKNKFDANKPIQSQRREYSQYSINYRSAGLRYWIIFTTSDFGTESASNRKIYFDRPEIRDSIFCALSSNFYWWYYSCNYDMFNQSVGNIDNFHYSVELSEDFESLAEKLDTSQIENRIISIVNKRDGTQNTSYAYNKKASKPIIDEIDGVLARHYRFTDEELDFIINYDIKYRMGDELNGGDE